MSSVNFAIQTIQEAATANVVGNMGAPLRTGELDEPSEDTEIQFSKDPFTFGLIPAVEERSDVGITVADPWGSLREG